MTILSSAGWRESISRGSHSAGIRHLQSATCLLYSICGRLQACAGLLWYCLGGAFKMLDLLARTGSSTAGLTRRQCLSIGSLCLGGLSLADLLQARAESPVRRQSGQRSVIMVYLPGGASHIDMYDMKPLAPAEYRGEFRSDSNQCDRNGCLRTAARTRQDRRQIFHHSRDCGHTAITIRPSC